MKLLEFINQYILTEAAIDRFIASNPELEDILRKFYSDMKPKYFPWVVKILKTDSNVRGNPRAYPTVRQDVELFDKFASSNQIKQKDINSYKTWLDMVAVIEDARKRKEEQEHFRAEKGKATKIFEDDTYLLVQPESKGASCTYGKGTQWCISATESHNYFDEYSEQGAKFIFIINKKTNDKDAFVYHPQKPAYVEIFNAADDPMQVEYLYNKYSESIIQKIKEYTGSEFEVFDLQKFIANPAPTITQFLDNVDDLHEKFAAAAPEFEDYLAAVHNIARDIKKVDDSENNGARLSDFVNSFVDGFLFYVIEDRMNEGVLSTKVAAQALLDLLEINKYVDVVRHRNLISFVSSYIFNKLIEADIDLKAYSGTRKLTKDLLAYLVLQTPELQLESKKKQGVTLKEFYKRELFS